ncbi:MAG: hypothetical protein AAGG68_08320 [Bacteroidota bacterium]
MTKSYLMLSLLLCTTCSTPEEEQKPIDYQLDHLILFVQNAEIKQQLDQILTPADLLQTEHSEQGTLGKYYLFLNANLELLYPQNDSIMEQNEPYFGSAYRGRWDENGAASIGIGLKMKPFDTSTIDFPYHLYQHPNWDTSSYYLMSKANKKKEQALVFIVTPESEQEVFQSLAEASDKVRPAIRADVLNYLTHPTGIKKLTNVEIEIPQTANLTTDNWDILQRTSLLTVTHAKHFGLRLTFDEGKQQQSVLLDSIKNIVIKY